MKFRKRPVVIDAIQYEDGKDNAKALVEFIKGTDGANAQTVILDADGEGPFVKIRTLEGDMTARLGDWIIRGIKGELYPCKPDIFAATYEPEGNRAGHRATCPSLLISKPGKCNCEAPYGAGGL